VEHRFLNRIAERRNDGWSRDRALLGFWINALGV
jgi:hypothetical protein